MKEMWEYGDRDGAVTLEQVRSWRDKLRCLRRDALNAASRVDVFFERWLYTQANDALREMASVYSDCKLLERIDVARTDPDAVAELRDALAELGQAFSEDELNSLTNKSNQSAEDFPESDFGLCPKCVAEGTVPPGGYPLANYGKGNWLFCKPHRVKWFVGSIIEPWETEEEQLAIIRDLGLEAFDVIKGFHWPQCRQHVLHGEPEHCEPDCQHDAPVDRRGIKDLERTRKAGYGAKGVPPDGHK